MTTTGTILIGLAIIGAALALVHQLRIHWDRQIERDADDGERYGA